MKENRKIKRYEIEKSPLYRIRRQKDLLRILQIAKSELSGLVSGTLYSSKEIQTRKGKIRSTETPVKSLRRVHERLTRLLMKIEPPPYLFCPVKGRSQILNAAVHKQNPAVRTVDIKDYFPSTPSSKVAWFFSNKMKCAPDVSAVLAKIITRNGHLPTGSPLSPIMAFYAFFEMWEKVVRLAEDAKCIATIYMDDLTVSGKEVTGALMWQIHQEIHNSGLHGHKDKSYRDRAAVITGVVVKEGKLLLPHRQHQKAHDTRLLQAAAQTEEEKTAYIRSLKGLANHREQIRLVAKLGLSEIR